VPFRPVSLALDPVTALPYHEKTLPAESARRMESTCVIEPGMQQRFAEFHQRGGEVYLPADVVSEEARETVMGSTWTA
jgi:hypothetical protein